MHPIKFKTAHGPDEGQTTELRDAEGVYAFQMFGYTWAAHKLGQGWLVSEITTGRRLRMPLCDNLEQAIEKAKAYLMEKGEGQTHGAIRLAKEQLNAVK